MVMRILEGLPRGGPCSFVPFQICPMFPCSHTLSECFRTVIFRILFPCSQKLANVPLFPSIFCQCSLVPQNPWETLILERQTLKCPRSLPYSTGRYGNALKLLSFKFFEAKNLWQMLFYKLTNCTNSTYQQCYKLLNLRSKLNGAFQRLPLYFSTKFTIQNIEEELQICFIGRTATKLKKQREPTHWNVALGQPRFHVREGLEMAVSRKFPRKIYFNLKISISWLEPLTKFTCKIWAKSVNLPVRRFSIWLHSYGVSLLKRELNPRPKLQGNVWK